MNRVRLLSFLAVCSASVAAPADFKGELAGRVIDAVTGKGIARARVVVSVGPSDPTVLLSDDEGAFRLFHLPAGGISAWAQRPGYLGDPFDPPSPESHGQVTISALAEGPATLTLKLTPESVIAALQLVVGSASCLRSPFLQGRRIPSDGHPDRCRAGANRERIDPA